MKTFHASRPLRGVVAGIVILAASAASAENVKTSPAAAKLVEVATNTPPVVPLNRKITIKDITIDDAVYTPYYNVETEQDHKQGAARKWIRLGVYFTTKGGWIDELDISQKAVLRKDDSKEVIVLSETEHYINIEPGDHYVYVYLHPSYVKRYDIDSFDLDSAAVISINGNVVAHEESAKHQDDGWSVCKKLKYTKGYLLNHAETPFWFINYDFKEIIKREDSPKK